MEWGCSVIEGGVWIKFVKNVVVVWVFVMLMIILLGYEIEVSYEGGISYWGIWEGFVFVNMIWELFFVIFFGFIVFVVVVI